MQINRNYKIGVLVLLSLAIFYYGSLFLRGYNIYARYNTYRVTYAENKNLVVSAPVKVKGHVVGTIKEIRLLPEDNYSTLAIISVEKRFFLTENSKVLLNSAGMMESNILELDLQPGTPLPTNSIIRGGVHPDYSDMDLKTMTAQVSTITNNLIKTTDGINAILINLEKTSVVLSATLDNLKHNIMAISKNMVSISDALADPLHGMPVLMPVIHKTVTDISALPMPELFMNMVDASKRIDTLLRYAMDSKGSLALLMKDRSLYDNINISLERLNHVLLDVQNKPSRYLHFSVFGCKNRIKKVPLYR